MAFQLSPGVNVSEIDQTTVVPSVSTTAGAFAGTFNWGPANEVTLIDSEISLAKVFGKPGANTLSNSATSFLSAANFLAYGNNLSVVRANATQSKNSVGAGTAINVPNRATFENSYLNQNNSNTYGAFIGRYPGALGNSLEIQVCDNSTDFDTWDYKNYFLSAPGTSDYAVNQNATNDEMHIVVIDAGGLFTGIKDTVLETFGYVSKAFDATLNGVSNYYKQVLAEKSQYVYAIDPVDYNNTVSGAGSNAWGLTAAGRNFVQLGSIQTVSLSGGTDANPTNNELKAGIQLFLNKESVDISLIITGDVALEVQNEAISVARTREDCIAFVSPPRNQVVGVPADSTIASNIITWAGTLTASTYAVADSGWKYQFDVYNNTYRWVPLNADIAGLCVFTDNTRDAWFSPAGFNRGAIKNVIKLAWNPSKTYRDSLYTAAVNPVVSFPGQGAVLFGDKTLTNRPSAFDRIGVRRLFILLEKSISRVARSSLFEQNDEFTRSQFVSTVTPFLRDVQGRRGITDFRVVCDTTNNTPNIIDSNQFVGDIYVKPSRSVNFIQLNFIAVPTGVSFTTIAG